MGAAGGASTSMGIQGVQLFAGLKANGFAGSDADFSAGARIAADAGFARPDTEDAEAAQFDSIACGKRLLESFEDGVDGRFSFGSRQACPLDDMVDNILLDQCRSSVDEVEFAPASRLAEESWRNGPAGQMLLRVAAVVNLRVLQYHKQLRASSNCTAEAGREVSSGRGGTSHYVHSK